MTFEEYAAARLPALLRYAAVLTGDRDLAQDIVQEVLARAHRRWRRIGHLDIPDAYIRRMITNEFLSWRRRWARVVPAGEIADSTRPVWTVDAPDAAAVHAERDALLAEIARLPRRQQAVLVLRYYLGLSDAEIADELGCRPVTVLRPGEDVSTVLAEANRQELEYPAVTTISVYPPGVGANGGFSLGAGESRESVEVNGVPARYLTRSGVSALEWEYAPGGRATILSGTGFSRQELLDVAAGTAFVDPYPARLPYRLDYLPGELEPAIVGQMSTVAGPVSAGVTFQSTEPPYGLGISVYSGAPSWPPDWPAPTNSTVGGEPAQCITLSDGQRCAVDIGELTVEISFGNLTDHELSLVLDGLTLATWGDPTTWFPVDAALPGG